MYSTNALVETHRATERLLYWYSFCYSAVRITSSYFWVGCTRKFEPRRCVQSVASECVFLLRLAGLKTDGLPLVYMFNAGAEV